MAVEIRPTTTTTCSPSFLYTADACQAWALAQGLEVGGSGYSFAGEYFQVGCYAYNTGGLDGHAFFGTGGSVQQMSTRGTFVSQESEYGGQYRLFDPACAPATTTAAGTTMAPEGCTAYPSKFIGDGWCDAGTVRVFSTDLI
jgi:hypothetical protein